MYASPCACMCVHACVYVHASIYVCVCVCTRMCVCVCLSVCVILSRDGNRGKSVSLKVGVRGPPRPSGGVRDNCPGGGQGACPLKLKASTCPLLAP